ncbi:MAG: TIGR04372 family glycosyltransferase [Nitrospinae bacterium]|nr:TIGR04372 family glycosyltransferase [Nitrospinota bacterium]
MFNKVQWKGFLLALQNRSYSKLIRAFSYVVFRFLGLLFAVPAIFTLWMLKPFVWIKVGILNYGRIGHLALNTDLFLRRRQLGVYPDGPFYCFLSNPNPANRQLLTMFKRIMPIYESRVLYGIFFGMLPILKRTPFHQDLSLNDNEYYEFNNADSSLFFTHEEVEKGRKLLSQMNVDLEKDEFICIFARDDAYLKQIIPENDWSYHDVRNSDIDSLTEAAKYLIEKGFTVIRVGSIVKKPISFSHKNMIDYPYSSYRSDFMDIFLLAHCKFIIASGVSGLCNVADIFDRPMLAVNVAEFFYIPIGKNSLYIPKKYKYIQTNEYLHFRDGRKMGYFWRNPTAHGLEKVDDSAQDILEATQEMLARLEKRFTYSPESEKLIQAYHKLWGESGVLGSPSKTPIGIAWLKKNKDIYF